MEIEYLLTNNLKSLSKDEDFEYMDHDHVIIDDDGDEDEVNMMLENLSNQSPIPNLKPLDFYIIKIQRIQMDIKLNDCINDISMFVINKQDIKILKELKSNYQFHLSTKQIISEFTTTTTTSNENNKIKKNNNNNNNNIIKNTTFSIGSYIYYNKKKYTTLNKFIKEKGPCKISNRTIQLILYQVLIYIHRYHSSNILFRLIDPNNILIGLDDLTIKIPDLGSTLSSSSSPISSSSEILEDCCINSFYYVAPELMFGSSSYSTSMDIWSIGCLFSLLLMGKELFINSRDLEYIENVSKIIGTPASDECYYGLGQILLKRENISSRAVDLLKGLLKWDPSKRLTIDQICNHLYFKSIHNPIYFKTNNN